MLGSQLKWSVGKLKIEMGCLGVTLKEATNNVELKLKVSLKSKTNMVAEIEKEMSKQVEESAKNLFTNTFGGSKSRD